MSAIEFLYFCTDEMTERVREILTARKARGDRCRLALSAAEASVSTTCVFVCETTELAYFEPRIVLARSLGARIETPTIARERAKYLDTQCQYAAYKLPKSKSELYAFWYGALERHVVAWQPNKERAVLLLMCGSTGVGKTCSVRSVLPNTLSATRYCKVRAVCASDVDTEDVEPTSALTNLRHFVAEHLRLIRSKQLPADAMVVAFFDDLEDVSGKRAATAYFSCIQAIAAMAREHPRNIAMVATCDNWYSSSPVVARMRKEESTLPFVVQRLEIGEPEVSLVEACLKHHYPRRSDVDLARIARQANGDFRLAHHMVEFGCASGDEFRSAAPCEHVRTLVRKTADLNRARKAGVKVNRVTGLSLPQSLFQEIDRSADIDYGDETLYANAVALVPTNYGKSGDWNQLEALSVLGETLDFLSHADRYDTSRLATNYAGRDALDIDKSIHTALAVTCPSITLGLATERGRNASNKLDYKGTTARSTRDAQRSNYATLRDVLPTLDMPARGLRGAVANDAQCHAHVTPSNGAFLLEFDRLLYVKALAAQGYLWLRKYGLNEDQATALVRYSLELIDKRASASAKTTCAELERESQKAVAKTTESTITKKPATKKRASAKMTDFFTSVEKKAKPTRVKTGI